MDILNFTALDARPKPEFDRPAGRSGESSGCDEDRDVQCATFGDVCAAHTTPGADLASTGGEPSVHTRSLGKDGTFEKKG